MTVLQALKSKVKYPLPEDFFLSVLIERGLSSDEEFTVGTASGKAFKLCRADCLIGQVDAPQIQQGGVSISLTDKTNFITLANAVYRQYGEPVYGEKQSEQASVTCLEGF